MSESIFSDAFKKALSPRGQPMHCPCCEKRVQTYTQTKRDTRHAGLWYKVRTTYCEECDADLNHETLDSGRR